MGWSCAVDAWHSYLQIVSNIPRLPDCDTVYAPDGKPLADAWREGDDEFFAEIGRENPDGAITGGVFKITERLPDGRLMCKRVATFRIEPDGTLTRGPAVFRRAWRRFVKGGD